jgi:PAS domain S-box-containing protein
MARQRSASAEIHYRDVFDFAPIGYAVLEQGDAIKEINRVGAEQLGIGETELVGQRLGAFVAPQSTGVFRTILAAARTDGAPARGDLDLWRSGVAVPVCMHAVALPRPGDTIMVAFEDLSARKEEARRTDEFLAMLSHELRNPLAPIRTSVAVLEMLALPSEDARVAVDIIARSSAHLTRIVDDLLDITRITRGKVQLQREVVDVNEIARRVLEEHTATIADQGLTAELCLASEPLHVDGDPVRLVQIVSNLLANAVKFTPHGGRISIISEARLGSALVHVRDTGIGIAPEVLDALGAPFVQAPQAIDRGSGGLGLGLATVRSLSELHGGTVEIRSNGIGRGTEVVVSIPLCERASPSAHHRSET